jgi:hypothetical protein
MRAVRKIHDAVQYDIDLWSGATRDYYAGKFR